MEDEGVGKRKEDHVGDGMGRSGLRQGKWMKESKKEARWDDEREEREEGGKMKGRRERVEGGGGGSGGEKRWGREG